MGGALFNAERFEGLMKKRGFTDGKLAYVSKVSRTMIFYLRKGEREGASAEILSALADALKTSPQYLLNQTDDESPNQKRMPALVADIADLANKLPPSRQREFQELGKTLLALEDRTDVETIYGEIMERITRLAEIEGGEATIKKLLSHLESTTERRPSPPVTRRRSAKDDGQSAREPTQSDE